ncbi:hypothetical protein D9J80_10010 [Escherichia coli]|nr:hypothetical protein [Escherichia coli]
MTKHATMNPLGSSSPYDLFDNAQNFDFAINDIVSAIWKDRFGISRPTLWGMEQTFSAQLLTQQQRFNVLVQNMGLKVIGDYESGPLTIKEYNEIIRYEGEFWKLDAKTAIPFTTTGADSTSWVADVAHLVSVGDAVLRQNLSSDQADLGDALITAKQSFTGAKQRTVHDKIAEFVTLFDFENVAGDGVTNDTAGVAVIDALSDAPVIYGLGHTFLVDAIPTSKNYSDGWWLVNGVRIPFDYVSVVRANLQVIALGPNAAMAANGARNQIAIGEDALRNNRFGRHNLAMGVAALLYLDGASSPSDIAGSRNIAFGGNAGRFMTLGSRNIIMGRDAGHNLTDAHLNVIIGVAAVMGDGPNTLDPGVIENQTPLTPSYSLVVGAEAGKYWNAAYGVLLGYQSGLNVKSDSGIVSIGPMAFSLHQSDMSYWGTTQKLVALTGTYSQSGSKTITVNATGHGMSTGFRVLMRFTTGTHAATTYQDDNWFVVTVVDADTFTIQSPVNATASGNVSISKIATTTAYGTLTGGCVGVGREVGNGISNYRSTGVGDRVGAKGLGVENSGFGYNIWVNYTPGAGCTAAGAYSQQSNNNAGGNTSFGVLTMAGNVLTGVSNSAFGPQAMRFVSTGSNNAAFGGNALRGLTTGNYNTAVGPDALRYAFGSTSTDHNYNNCSGLGYQSYCSGDNQVQLGNSATTTYVYGTVQNRSDERDKADIRDTELGIEFILGLRPVDGRWDMRDDYIEFYPDAPEKPEAPVEPEAPPPPFSIDSDAELDGQDPDNIRIYHLDGDPTNPYSRVIETGSSGLSDDPEEEYPEDDYPRLLAIYLQERAAYEINLAQYQTDLITYKNDCALWEAECERIKEHNARVAKGELRDGSKKRERFHHWFIAQEVKELCEKLGVDFGGYQDHSIAGGGDVKTLGYDEFIPPTIRSVQQCWKRMNEQDARMDAQDEKITQLEAQMAAIKKLLSTTNQ